MSVHVVLLDGGAREETVRVERAGPGLYDVELRGRTVRVDALALDAATLSLLVDGASHRVELDRRPSGVRVHVAGGVERLDPLDERRLRILRQRR